MSFKEHVADLVYVMKDLINPFDEESSDLIRLHARDIMHKSHDDVIKWKHFPRDWPFVREIHRSPVNFPHKGQWRGALMFSLIYAWINDWVNNREAGDLRRQHGHYDVIVMFCQLCCNDPSMRLGRVYAIQTRKTDKPSESDLRTHLEEQSLPIQWTTTEIHHHR